MEIESVDNFSNYYSFSKKPLGSGRYGEVKRGRYKYDNQNYACKIVKRKSSYLRELDHLIQCNNCVGILPCQRVLIDSKKMLMQFELGSFF